MTGFPILLLAMIQAETAPPPALSAKQEVAACRADIANFTGGTGTPHCERQWRGLSYTMYRGWSGSIKSLGAKWSFSCRQDEIDDERSCLLLSGTVSLSKHSRFGTLIGWGQNTYPGSLRYLRIDKGAPIVADGDGGLGFRRSGPAYQQMKRGEKAVFRWTGWPYQDERTVSLDLTGFSATADLYDAIFSEFQQ
jgi:hypothetical protein